MKNIAHSFNGLASSLFLSVGLHRLAEKLEPMGTAQTHRVTDARNCGFCEVSNFPVRPRN